MTTSSTVRELVGKFVEDANHHNCHYWHQLEAMPDLPVDEVVSLLKNDPDEQVRAGAVLAVRWLGLDSGLELLTGAVRSDPSPLVRAYAADGLGKLDASGKYPIVLEALQDPEPAVRSAALKSINYIAELDDIPDILETALNNPERSVRKAALENFLMCYGDDYVDILLRVLQSDDAEMRALAAEFLAWKTWDRIDEAANAALNHPDEMVRAEFAGGLCYTGDRSAYHPRAEKLLTQALTDPSPRVRAKAAESYRSLESPASLDPLRHAFDDVDLEVRCEAMVSLGRLKDAESLDKIIAELSNPVPRVRYKAVWALSLFEDKRAVIPLQQLLNDESWMIRLRTAYALAQLEDTSVIDFLIPWYRSSSTRVRRCAIASLSRLEGNGVNDVLIDAISDPDSEVALTAAGAFKRRQEPRAIRLLAALMHSGDESWVNSIVYSLYRQEDPQAAQVLLEAMEDEKCMPSAAFYLVRMQNPAVVEPLIEALVHPNRRIRREAALNLGRAGKQGLARGPRVVEALINALQDKDEHTRMYAARALASFNDPKAIAALIQLLSDDSISAAAMDALGHLRAQSAVEPLIAIMEKDKLAYRRRTAVEALGKIGTPQALDALYDFALRHCDGEEWVKEDVVEALRNAGDPRADDL